MLIEIKLFSILAEVVQYSSSSAISLNKVALSYDANLLNYYLMTWIFCKICEQFPTLTFLFFRSPGFGICLRTALGTFLFAAWIFCPCCKPGISTVGIVEEVMLKLPDGKKTVESRLVFHLFSFQMFIQV